MNIHKVKYFIKYKIIINYKSNIYENFNNTNSPLASNEL